MDIMQQIKEEWKDKPDIWVVNITIGELKELIKIAEQNKDLDNSILLSDCYTFSVLGFGLFRLCR